METDDVDGKGCLSVATTYVFSGEVEVSSIAGSVTVGWRQLFR